MLMKRKKRKKKKEIDNDEKLCIKLVL